jgi:hypothetical protein
MFKLLLLLILLISNLYSNNISWYGKYDKALQASHEQSKNMMILIISSKEKSSLKIIEKLFMNNKYIEHLNKNYINILINVDYKTSYPIELFYTTNFPSLFFASYTDESFLVDPIYDLNKKEQILEILKKLEK